MKCDGGALSDDDVCLSVCRQSHICEACMKTAKPISVTIWDNVGAKKINYWM